ncbi:hypothetical protein FHQ08_12420 [Lactobacillus sp. CC-MHH1034]|nr:hypothetical protein [Agrilactobacillus fermenti]
MILLKDSVEIEGELRNKVVVSFRRLTKSGKPVIKTYEPRKLNQEIKELKRQGMNNTQIAQKLNITVQRAHAVRLGESK